MATFVPPRADLPSATKWFEETTTIDGPFRELLEKYSHIPADEVVSHVVQVRNKAWQIHPYPCLGQFRFLELNLSKRTELYGRLLASLQAGGRFLDVGCCLGQDIRKLIFDGAPPASVAGAELNEAFIRLGRDLFNDHSQAGVTEIVAANILEPVVPVPAATSASPPSPLAAFAHSFTAVQLGMILHLFTWNEQVTALEHTLSLLRGGPGDVIFGQATGHLDGASTGTVGRPTFKHSAESFAKLVEQVGQRTGTTWKVTASLDNGLSIYDGKRTWDDPKTRRLLFEMVRT